MRVLFPVVLRLAAATSFFSVCAFLYGQHLKGRRKTNWNQNCFNLGEIVRDEVQIQVATPKTECQSGNEDSYGPLPISRILQTYLSGGRKGSGPEIHQSGAGSRTCMGTACLSNINAGHPRNSVDDSSTSLYQVVQRKMQDGDYGVYAEHQSTPPEILKEESSSDENPGSGSSSTISICNVIPSSASPTASPTSVERESKPPDQQGELFDSATSMTFSTSDIGTHAEDVIIDEELEEALATSSGNEKLPVCRTPDSDRGFSDEGASTSDEEEIASSYLSGNSVYWNTGFQETEWHRRTFSPIAEEPEEGSSEGSYRCLRSSRSDSCSTDSSSDLVFETIFSTSQNPEEINDNDLADLKDDPDFVSLLLQNDEGQSRSTDEPEGDCFEEVTTPHENGMATEEFNLSRQVLLQKSEFELLAAQLSSDIVRQAVKAASGQRSVILHNLNNVFQMGQWCEKLIQMSIRGALNEIFEMKRKISVRFDSDHKQSTCPQEFHPEMLARSPQTAFSKDFYQKRTLFDHINSYAEHLSIHIVKDSVRHVGQRIHPQDIVIFAPSQRFPKKSKAAPFPSKHSKLPDYFPPQSGHNPSNPEMLSRSTQTEFSKKFSKKSAKPLLTTVLLPETASRIPRKLRDKVWQRLKKAKRKYEFYAKHKKKSLEFTADYRSRPESFVTVAVDDQSAANALVLAHSLKWLKTSKNLCVLIGNQVSPWIRQLLADVYHHVYLTSELCSHDDLALSLLGRPELGVTFTKLHCWRLTQFQKCVYLDADTLVLQNCDELFDREELSAVPDTGWPDCFNSGVFVFRPSLDTYAKLVSLALSKGSFDGGDQGLLNTYFGNWRSDLARRLPFIYNMVSNVSYTYAPAYKQYATGVKIVHFLGAQKPWSVRWRTDTGALEQGQQSWDLHSPYLQMWIGVFRDEVLPKISEAAKNYVYKSTSMTVSQLLYRISSGNFSEYEDRHNWGSGDLLVQTYFPSHADAQPFVSQQPEPPFRSMPSPSSPQPPHSSPPPPPPPPCSENQSWSSTPAPPPCSEIPSHFDHRPSTPPPSPPQYAESVESARQKFIHAEPADPHWEALLWHSVQSPWEPPSPPPPDEYQPPPSQHSEPPNLTPTFGWFSSDSGARSSQQEPPPAPSWHEPDPPSAPSWHEPDPPPAPSAHEPEPAEVASVQTPCPSTLKQSEESASTISDQDDRETVTRSESSFTRMRSWEEGNIDYLGKDRFENIWKKLEFMFAAPGPKSELEDLKESLKDSIPQSPEQFGSVASSSLTEDDDVTLVPDDSPEPQEEFPGYPEGDYSGMFAWQEGRIDYCGRDKSDNILRRLDFIISGEHLQEDE